MKIIESASKLVFVMLILTACIAFLIGILAEAQFMLLAIGASSFYFSNKGDQNKKFLGK